MTHLRLHHDVDLMLEEVNNKHGYAPFLAHDYSEFTKIPVDWWHVKSMMEDEDSYGREFGLEMGSLIQSNDIHVRYYIQFAGGDLGMHKDYGTKCGINILLSENSGPVVYEDGEHYYTCALLNTQEDHAVPAYEADRLLYKISVMDLEYEEVYERLNDLGAVVS